MPNIIASPALDRACVADRAGVLATSADGGKAACWGVSLPNIIASPALDRACVADRAGVLAAGADGGVGSFIVYGRANRDLGAAQPAVYSRVGREIARLWRNLLPIRRRECEFDPAVFRLPRVDPADLRTGYLYRAAPQPTLVINAGREVALRGQHAHAARRLPAELDAAIVKESRDDAPGGLIVALGLNSGEIGGDDRGQGGRGQCEERERQEKRITPPPPVRTFVLP